MSHRTAPAATAFVLTLTLAACTTPGNLDLSLQHPSQEGRFVVRMEPPATGPAINQMHVWQVQVRGADGTPVTQARLSFDGGMPQHGHGFPTRPRVTREVSPGVYALDGMKFSMTGWWDMRLTIRAGEVSDTAVFNVVMTDNGLQR